LITAELEQPPKELVQPRELTGNVMAVGRFYQQALERNPRNPVALAGMCLVALSMGKHRPAIDLATLATEIAPEMRPAWVALGQALKGVGRFDEAEAAYRRALALDGLDALALMGMGELMIARENPEESARFYSMALRKFPVLVSAHMGLGHARTCMGRFEEAYECYQQALKLKPRLADAEYSCGYVLSRMGRAREAENCYRRALRTRPDFAAAWLNMGSLLREQGRDIYAEAALVRAIELRPDLIGAWLNLAVIERDRKNYPKAEEFMRRAFALDPSRVDTLVTWAQYRCHRKDLAGAWAWLRWAMLQDSCHSEAANTLGILLHTEGRFEEAVEAFERAEELGNRAAPSNRGNSLLDLGRVEEALKAHQTAVDRDPASPGARYNLAMTQLRTGDYERGWAGYEARWDFREVHRFPRIFRQPRWNGEPLAGRRVLLDAEQGLGDTIQFCRYVSMVVARGGTALLQVLPGVRRLLESLDAVRSGQVTLCKLGVRPPEFDLECPLMSLPAVFHTRLHTVPWNGPYLFADPLLVQEKRAQLEEFLERGKLRVGIGWAGNPNYKADYRRSTHLSTFYPLLQLPNLACVSLQKGEPARQIAHLPESMPLFDACSQERDLAETAAVIENLDLVITTDTSVAHVAGAMGKPTWILLPHLADWRWMRFVETTPWYPTVRLLRQKTAGDWAEVMERVLADVQERIDKKSSHRRRASTTEWAGARA
jgi:tetratricopeptide (TPR) repeat protein